MLFKILPWKIYRKIWICFNRFKVNYFFVGCWTSVKFWKTNVEITTLSTTHLFLTCCIFYVNGLASYLFVTFHLIANSFLHIYNPDVSKTGLRGGQFATEIFPHLKQVILLFRKIKCFFKRNTKIKSFTIKIMQKWNVIYLRQRSSKILNIKVIVGLDL